jgi:hypothetical protein
VSVDMEILSLADQMEKLRPFAEKDIDGEVMFLSADEQASFNRLALEAKGAINDALGQANDFTGPLSVIILTRTGAPGTSYATVSEAAELLRGAVNRHKLRLRSAPMNTATRTSKPPYVDMKQIVELRSIETAKWDFSRLVQLCRELNAAHEGDNYLTIAMLVRAITDHVPPIFTQPHFQGVANNYAGHKSFKNSMTHLDRSLRNIADSALHTQIRPRESVPGPTQVNFGADLAVLLDEVIRISS